MLTYAYVVLMNRLAALKNEEGQGMVEYALIIALIGIALVVALGVLEGGIGDAFEAVNTKLDAAIP